MNRIAMLRRVKGCLASKPKDPKSDGVLVPADDPVTQPIRPTTPTSMDSPAANYQKARAVEQAVRQQAITVQWASRTGDRQPPYNLLELIGKGTYGRVYKA